MNKKKHLPLFLLFFMVLSSSFGQEPSSKSIKLGLGLGMHMGNNTDGSGIIYSIGYQKNIWKDRLWFNPNFSIGQYSSKLLPLDARDQYFNSYNIETKLFYDLIKTNSFSIVLGAGAFANNSKGLKGTGGYPDYYSENLRSEYISDYHIGGYLGGGFRISSNNKRTSINVLPLNIHIGTNNFLEFNPTIEIDIKL